MRCEAVGDGQVHDEKFRRLRWRCRRGLLELDLWLERFAAGQMQRLSLDECTALDALLEEADADLLAWLEGRQAVPSGHTQLIDKIRSAV
jgi:antitoxin CptB